MTQRLLFNLSLCSKVKGQEQLFTHQLETNITGLQKDRIIYSKCFIPYRIYQTDSTFSPRRITQFMFLDDYSVQIIPEIKEALPKRGYVHVIIGGGVTRDIQVNDTDLHALLKVKYREQEQSLMIDQLRANLKKIPQPTQDDMMRMLTESFKSLEIDFANRFEALCVTKTSDYLVSERLMSLVGEKMKAFRDQLKKKKSPKKLKELLKLITPPKRKF